MRIVFLGSRLLIRWRSGHFHAHAHSYAPHEREHRHRVRSPLGAFTIGLVHGIGGSAGVAVLLLAAIPSRTLAVCSLLLLAASTAVSMTMLTGGFGRLLVRPGAQGALTVVTPSLGLGTLAFGIWYAAAAWSLAPYPF